MPRISIAQVAGSGTAPLTAAVKMFNESADAEVKPIPLRSIASAPLFKVTRLAVKPARPRERQIAERRECCRRVFYYPIASRRGGSIRASSSLLVQTRQRAISRIARVVVPVLSHGWALPSANHGRTSGQDSTLDHDVGTAGRRTTHGPPGAAGLMGAPTGTLASGTWNGM
jgi:hypothetical protein